MRSAAPKHSAARSFMPFKAEEPAAGALGLFPKGASAKPKEGEIRRRKGVEVKQHRSLAKKLRAARASAAALGIGRQGEGPIKKRVHKLQGCLRRLASWKHRSAEQRRPSGPALHALPCLMAKPPCLRAARLEAASRQALEELILKLLQILLCASPTGAALLAT